MTIENTMPNRILLSLRLLLLSAVCATLLASCREESGRNDTTENTPVSISLRLKWLVQVHSAGEILAERDGFFRQNGLDCEIKAGGPEFDSIRLVAAGQDDFGVTSADQLILARAKGIPIVAIGVLFQETPVCFFARKVVGLSSVGDFVGRTVGVKYGTNAETEFAVLLKRAGIDRDSITQVPVKFDLAPFLAGKVDVWPGLESNEPLAVQRQGVEVEVLRSRDHGIQTYSNVYFTTEKKLADAPEQVEAFMRSVKKGWIRVRQDPTQGLDAVIAINDRLDRDHEHDALELTLPIIFTEDDPEAFGRMTLEGWKQTESVLIDGGLLEENINLESCFRPVLDQ